MSSSPPKEGVLSSINKDQIVTATKGLTKFIYRTSFPSEPTDDDYTPPEFDGPRHIIDRLHGFPRAGFTNNIAALASTTAADGIEPGTDGVMDPAPPSQPFSNFGGGNNSTYIQSNVDPNLPALEYIPPSQTSQLRYNKQDASDYIKGIATVAIIIICIYVLWGLSLLLLRVGRIDWCFRLWCCKKKKRSGDDVDDEGEGGEDGDEEEEDEIDQDCCCITCRESIRAKGGCCTRNVFCGWLAGKPPTVPTKSSLERERAMREKKLIKSGVKAVGGGIETMNKTVMGVVKKKDGDDNNKLKNSGGTDGADNSSGVGGGGEDVIASAEMAVAAVANEKEEEEDPQDRAEQQEEGEGKAADDTDDNTTTDIIITDEYLHKRQQASRRTMLAIRIIFLISAVLVIIFSIKLVVDGYRGINGIFDSIHRAIDFIADHIESIKTEVDNYIEVNQEMAQRKAEWLNRTRAQISGGGLEDKPWCPLALMNDGKIQVDISLAKLLLRGTLFKLAFVDQAVGVVDTVVDTVQGQVGGGVVNSTRYLNETESSTNTEPGMLEQAQTAVGNTVTTAETAVSNTVNTVTEDVTNAVSTAAQSTMDVVNTVTGDVASKACMTVEECRQASEEQGLPFISDHSFDSHGCFTVTGEAVYWGEGTLEQIISPYPNDGQSSTLHERVVCKAVTAAAVGVVSNAVKQQKMVVTTFLDDLQIPGGKKVQNILGKALQLKNQIGGGRDLDEVDSDSDSDEIIRKLVTRLTALVQTLVQPVISKVSEKVDGDGQRSLQDTNAVGAVIETIVEKDGVNYTILSLSENFTGSDLIINGYNVTNLFTTNLTFEIDVATLTKSVNEKFEDSSEFLLGIFNRLQVGLNSVYDQARGAQDSLESILPYFNVATVFVAFLILLTLFFIVGTVLAWNNKQPRLFRCAQDRVILPIFILIGLFVWIFTTVFLTLGVLAGDYCFVSPDVQMNNILDQTLAQLSPMGYKFAYYYFNGCKLANRPVLMSVAYNALIGLRVGLDQFFELVNNMGEGPLRRACGLGDVTDIADGDPVNALAILVNVIRNSLGGAMTTVLAVGKLTLCKSFYPMYSFLAHQVLCTDFINLLGPMFSSMFMISIFSMVMVTMRVAWHELVEDDVSGGADDKLENEECLENEEVVEEVEDKVMGAEDTENAEKEDAAVPGDKAVTNDDANVEK